MNRRLTNAHLLAVFLIITPIGWAQNKPESSGSEQEERARAAMEQSLAHQQASIQGFQDAVQAVALRQQQESSKKQYTATHGGDNTGEWAPLTPLMAREVAQSEKTPGFFQESWPSAPPLAVPNVQVVDDSCEALRTETVDKLVRAAAQKHALDAGLLKSIMRQESGFKPCALSVAGAMGLMQIMPETAEMLGLDDPFDEAKNVDAGAKFFKMMLNRYQGDVRMALAAYNAGPGRVDKTGDVPLIPETLDYVEKVLGGMPLAY